MRLLPEEGADPNSKGVKTSMFALVGKPSRRQKRHAKPSCDQAAILVPVLELYPLGFARSGPALHAK